MTEKRYLTRREAAALSGKHVDTIRRAERAGKLPGARVRDDGTIELLDTDLVEAGLIEPAALLADITEVTTRSREAREIVQLRKALAVAEARVFELNQRVEENSETIRGLLNSLNKAVK